VSLYSPFDTPPTAKGSLAEILVSKRQVFQNKILYSNDREVTYVTACEAVHFVEENSWHHFFSVTQ